MAKQVSVWEEKILIPTYGTGKPEKNPMFFEKRVYQGSSGSVYPYPVIEKIEDTCEDKEYQAVYLENEYIKVMVLPELGGRIQMAYDKIKERHFIYYNHVIKPALVGLTGPWISGGIEFNWPQHHRPSTFLPVDYTTEILPDGGACVWVSERERMFHQKGMAGFILRPGKAVIEIQGKLYNPTPVPQTFLWWANPAVAVNDQYQSVFPNDVNAVFDHGKRDVSSYPVATGTYYKIDYSAGVDISRYKNIPVPTSFMAVHSNYDFVGGYENDTRAGLLHVANHHISPGKKQWTWGHGDFGKAWDRNLTDTDGPYIELMTGVYTDNQPDFTWLQPYEEKTFVQYFMPYRELGMVKNASSDILMNLETEEGKMLLKVMVTSPQQDIRMIVSDSQDIRFDRTENLSPEKVFTASIPGGSGKEIEVKIYNKAGKCILGWSSGQDKNEAIPDPAKAALDPADIETSEQLYLTGLHLEQYRHATYCPTDYYREAIRRDPSDIRNNNALGLWLIRKGKFAEAEPYLRQAVATWTEKNPNPYDGEPLYNLGLCLKWQDKKEEAYDKFYKACWSAAWQDAGYFSLAQLSCASGEWENALYEIDKSLVRNWHNHRSRHLKAVILRQLDQTEEALALIRESLALDAFNFGCLYEKYRLTQSEKDLQTLVSLMRSQAHNYTELALDYANAGCWEDAIEMIDTCSPYITETDSMAGYYKAWFLIRSGRSEEARQVINQTEKSPLTGFFPNSSEALIALQEVNRLVPQTPRALYLLGNIWYDKRQYTEAITAWEQSATADPEFPTVFRNLSLAYYNKLDKKEEALQMMENAFRLDPTDSRVLMELDQLYKRINYSSDHRLNLLEQYKEITWQRDDLYLEYITLLNQTERYTEAIDLINNRKFHPWEGGEGKVPAQYQLARMELVKQLIGNKRYQEGLKLVDECYIYPENLGEGKLPGAQENDFNYYKGVILQKTGQIEEANEYFRKASEGISEPAAAMYYNDQKPDKIFYQGLSLRQLGKEQEAQERFKRLITYGETHLDDLFKMDYFAVSLPDLQIWEDDMTRNNRIHCNYLIGLGNLGLGNKESARDYFNRVLEMNRHHQGAQIHLKMTI